MVSDDPETAADLDGHTPVTSSFHNDCSDLNSHCGFAAIEELMDSESTTNADTETTQASNQNSAA